MNPGLQDFGPMNYLRRTDSKDSSCTSLSSASHMHDRALTASMSVPAVAFGVSIYLATLKNEIFYVYFLDLYLKNVSFQNKFRRTDSTDSSTSSLASFSQMFGLSRNNSKKTGPNPYGPQGIGSSGHAPVTISHGHLQGNRYQVGISPLAQSHPPEKKRSVESVKSHTSKSR